MGSNVQCEELLQLKIELVTVVETLSLLHDFVDNVFGSKFHVFCEEFDATQGSGKLTSSPRSALHELRWKYLNSSSERPISCSSTKTNVNSEDSHPTPGIVTPEVINVKLEVDCDVPDFLEDVDPFTTDDTSHGGYNNEQNDFMSRYEDEVKVETYNEQPIKSESPSQCMASAGNRFVPGLIPLHQQDPLGETEIQDEDGLSTSSESSEHEEWRPSLSSKKVIKNPDKREKKWTPVLPSANKLEKCKLVIQPIPSSQISRQCSSGSGGEDGASFKCSLCPASYKQEESLRSHQKYKHNPTRVQCQCHLCGKSMVDKYRLQRHIRLHTGEKPFSCLICGQSFYRKDYHTKHLQRKHGLSYTSSTVTKPSTPTDPLKKFDRRRSLSSKSETSKRSTTSNINITPTSVVSAATSLSYPRSETQRNLEIIPTVNVRPNIIRRNHIDQTSADITTTTKEPHTLMDYYASHSSGSATALTASSLVHMTSLTFDDLISADF